MRARRIIGITLAAAGLLAPGAVRAETPRVERLTLAGGVPVNVVLPANYDASSMRYPVVYLLHGYSENENTWISQGGLLSFAADKQVIFVAPGGDPDGWYTDWRDGRYAWETFHLRTLIPFIDASYRTIAGREGRAIVGLSMGGFGAMSYAARHPDTFVAAASFSGAVDTTHKSPAAPLAIAVAFAPKSGDDRFAVWGNPVTDEVWWRAHNPTELASNLRGVSLYIANGDGIPEADDPFNPTGTTGERAILEMAHGFADALRRARIEHTLALHGGLHTWKYWKRDLANAWPQLSASFGTPPPATFDHRAVEPRFSVWGWSFEADPARAPEFLDVHDASCAGVRLAGSGIQRVTTAPCFEPGATVSLQGATSSMALADETGRITFTVDLGPAHTLQQFTAAGRAAALTPGYVRTGTVTFG